VIEISGAVAESFAVPLGALETLPRRELTADFHCVSGWSATNLRWEGVAFETFYRTIIEPSVQPGSSREAKKSARRAGGLDADSDRHCCDRRATSARSPGDHPPARCPQAVSLGGRSVARDFDLEALVGKVGIYIGARDQRGLPDPERSQLADMEPPADGRDLQRRTGRIVQQPARYYSAEGGIGIVYAQDEVSRGGRDGHP